MSEQCPVRGTGPDGLSVHLQESAGPERRHAAAQTGSVSAAEDSLPPAQMPGELAAWRGECTSSH